MVTYLAAVARVSVGRTDFKVQWPSIVREHRSSARGAPTVRKKLSVVQRESRELVVRVRVDRLWYTRVNYE